MLPQIPTSLTLWNVVLSIAIVSIGFAYVLQVASATQHGYTMRDLETAVSELELQNETLDTAIAEATSLETVAERMQILGFVEPAQVVYITGSGEVAVR